MNPLKQQLNNLPSDLVDVLQEEFQKLHTQYFLGRWEPSQFDGGRFTEAVLRIVEYKDKNIFTPIGTQPNRNRISSSAEQNMALASSLRLQIPRLSGLMLDFRNNRNIAHLSAINVNEMDSVFVLQAANWIVAELIRLEAQISAEEAQEQIKKIIERKVPIIEDIGGRLKCLNPSLGLKNRILVFCYQKYPESISIDDLFDWTGYSNKSVLKDKMVELDKDGKIDFCNNSVRLTKAGLLWVEKIFFSN